MQDKPSTQSAQPSGAPRWTEYMRLADIKPAKVNPKDHDIGAVSESMEEHGFVEQMTLDERTGRLVAGHGRLETLTLLKTRGEKPPEGVEERDGEWYAPVARGWRSRSDRQARSYVIASNRTVERGGWKDPTLASELQALAKADALRGTGYDADDADALLKRLGGSYEPPPAVVDEGDKYQVVVTCASEAQQVQLLQRLAAEGLQVRALVG